MRDMPCDNLPCMNRIPYDKWKAAVDKDAQIIFCGHCEDSPPPSPWLVELCEMDTMELIGVLQDAIDSAQTGHDHG